MTATLTPPLPANRTRLVLGVLFGERVEIGPFALIVTPRDDGSVKLVIEAPRDLPIARASAVQQERRLPEPEPTAADARERVRAALAEWSEKSRPRQEADARQPRRGGRR